MLWSSVEVVFPAPFFDLLAKIKIIVCVYFLLDMFAMFAGTILLRHDPEAAVPLQSIGWNMAFCLVDNSKMVKPKRSLTLGDGLYTQYHPIMIVFCCFHIELHAFHCFCVCANVCSTSLVSLHSTLCVASSPQFIVLLPSPPTKEKEAEGGEGAWKWVDWKRWKGWRCLVDGGESVARVEWGWRRWPAWSKNETNR